MSTIFEIDSLSNYTVDDVECFLYGSVAKRNKHPRLGLRKSFKFINRNGYANMGNTDWGIPAVTEECLPNTPQKNLRFSSIPTDMSTIKVIPDTSVSSYFRALPEILLNSKSCAFEFDTIACKQSGVRINPDCLKYYISIKFKDGNIKTWSYYDCVFCTDYVGYSNLQWMEEFINKLKYLNNLPSDHQRYLLRDDKTAKLINDPFN